MGILDYICDQITVHDPIIINFVLFLEIFFQYVAKFVVRLKVINYNK